MHQYLMLSIDYIIPDKKKKSIAKEKKIEKILKKILNANDIWIYARNRENGLEEHNKKSVRSYHYYF